ncbi:hypothetical protein O181_125281 [Austropuccinia psidii MF-1]|uniref:Uncharacterized protein n=1 Tax=Austropuccinia psidii MF-1 TaxID=1389203 RepID=A0A9Q3KST6_9BASI|nr:hypothetical protein [Austropuccinia psidii MF-1]
MITINNILRIFIEEMVQLNSGIFIQTPHYPKGRKVVVHLGCLIGDLLANYKVLGFASHSDTRFCSWCEFPKAKIQQLKLAKLQQKRIVKDYSIAFKGLNNDSECTRMVRRTGIRWSELNHLDYWDPVQQIPLGIMHNWFEGILQHHFRRRWRWDFDKMEINNNESTHHDSQDDSEMQDGDTSGQAGLSWEQGQNMRLAFLNVIIPFGLTRIPSWLRQAKEGKNKSKLMVVTFFDLLTVSSN